MPYTWLWIRATPFLKLSHLSSSCYLHAKWLKTCWSSSQDRIQMSDFWDLALIEYRCNQIRRCLAIEGLILIEADFSISNLNFESLDRHVYLQRLIHGTDIYTLTGVMTCTGVAKKNQRYQWGSFRCSMDKEKGGDKGRPKKSAFAVLLQASPRANADLRKDQTKKRRLTDSGVRHSFFDDTVSNQDLEMLTSKKLEDLIAMPILPCKGSLKAGITWHKRSINLFWGVLKDICGSLPVQREGAL